MIRINLLPHDVLVERPPARGKELGAAGGLFAASLAAIATVHTLQTAHLTEVSAIADDLEKQVATLRKQNQNLTELTIHKKDREEKIRTLVALVDRPSRVASLRVLDELSRHTPEKLWLTEYQEHQGFARIRGKSINAQTIAAFAHNLSSSPYLGSVEIRETQQDLTAQTPQGDKSATLEGVAAAAPTMTQFFIEAVINHKAVSSEKSGSATSSRGEGRK